MFKKYPNTRVIIDCTEVYIQQLSSLSSQAETFSSYKHHNTFKVLVGISPTGEIIYISKLWGGQVSDRKVTECCSILDLLEPGDNVMADRGFDIQDLLAARHVKLNIPPFPRDRSQLTSSEVTETRRNAELRIHVERAIGRIKSFHILDGFFPITLSHIVNEIFTVCAFLTNFMPPLCK